MGIQYHNNKRRLQDYYKAVEVPHKISRPAAVHRLTPENITFLQTLGFEVIT